MDQIERVSTELGVPIKILVIAGIIGLGFIAYKNYLESYRAKLDIHQKLRDLNLEPNGIQKVLFKH